MIPLKWHGGKHYLAKHIIDMMPVHTHYVEPFFGSGAVLFAKPAELVEKHSEVINDLNYNLTLFYVVIRNEKHFIEFIRRAELTPFSEIEWQHAKRGVENEQNVDIVTRALQFFIRYRQSRQGIGRSFATLSRNRTRKGMNEQAASWLGAVDCLYEAHERLRRVVVLSQHANDVVRAQDGVNTFFYLDPPYVPDSRTVPEAYEVEMTLEEHKNLLMLLSSVKGKFILSGYKNSLYDLFAKDNKWKCKELVVPHAASGAAEKEMRIECLWYNY